MKDEGYINIQGWMINQLELKGNELLLFAIIYGFSQDGKTRYRGSLSYIEKAVGISRPAIISNLNRLIEKKFIRKELCKTGNLYSAEISLLERLVVKKLYRGSKETLLVGSKESLLLGSKETLHNIYNNNNKDNNNNKSFISFWEKYPKKVGKQKSEKEWKKLNPSSSLVEKIISHIETKKEKTDWTKENNKYVVYPERFIRDRRWEDEIDEEEKLEILRFISK